MKLPKNALPVRPVYLLIDRPELAFFLGAILVEWANVEGYFTTLYSVLMEGPGALAHTEVFDHIRDVPTKRNILVAVTKGVVKSTAYKAILNDLYSEFQRVAGKRNRYVHCRWLISDKYPKKMIWLRRMTPNWMSEVELVGDRELEKTFYEIADLRIAVTMILDPRSDFRRDLKAFQLTGKWPRQRKPKKQADRGRNDR